MEQRRDERTVTLGIFQGHSRLSAAGLGPGTYAPASGHPAQLLGAQLLEDQMALGTVAREGRSQTTCFPTQHRGVSLAGGAGGF